MTDEEDDEYGEDGYVSPAFLFHPKEAALIGRMLAGYGEIEYELCACLGFTMGGGINAAAKVIYAMRGERARIVEADNRMKQHYAAARLTAEYDDSIAAVHWCREVRNLYSHCQWADTPGLGLQFAEIEEAVKQDLPGLPLTFHSARLGLLQEQAIYFRYTSRCLTYLAEEFRVRTGQLRLHAWSWPTKLPQPLKRE
jgi:hypothetical protein